MSSDRDRSPIDRSRRRPENQRSNDCRVFVSNFPYEVRWQELKDLFREHVGNVEYVELFNDESGKPRGCGIMEFASPEVTKEVVKKMDKMEWKGRKLSVKEAADAERDKYGRIVKSDRGRTSHRDSSTGGRGSNRVYVSNLPYEMKWQDVKDLFRDHVGEVAYVELFNDERGKPRGCGILEFDSEELAQKAIRKLNKHELKGRKMMVQEALDSERDKYGYIIKDGSGGGSRGGRSDRGDRGGDRDRDRRGGDRDRGDRDRQHSSSNAGPRNFGYTYGLSVEFLESLGIEGPLQCKVFVANLCFTVDEQKLRDVFRLAGRIVSVEVSKDRDGKSRGYGLVEYTHPVEAVQAISMFNNQKLYDRPMGVRFDRDPSPEETRLPNRLPEGLAGVGMGLGAGGKPLTDVLKNLQQNNDNLGADNKSDNVLNSNSVKTLADLTPALALIAQLAGNQAGALGNVNQGNIPMGGAGFGNMNNGNMNPGNMNTGNMNPANMNPMGGNFGFNNSTVVPQQQQPQQNMNTGYGNMGGGGYNMGQAQQSYNTMPGSNMGPPSNLGPSNMGSSNIGPSNMGTSNMGSSNINRQGNIGTNMGPGLLGSSSNQGYSTLASSTGTGPSISGDRRQNNLGRPTGGPQGSSHLPPVDRSDRRPESSAPYNPVPAPYSGEVRSVDAPSARPDFDTVMVRNLPPELEWQDLREFFSTCGDVKNVMIKERGVGLIRFATERSAERALNYDGTSKWGRTLDVRIY